MAGLNLSRLINEDAPTPTIDLYDASKRKLMDASGKIGIILAHSDSIDLDVSGRKGG